MNQLPVGVQAPDFELKTPDERLRRLNAAVAQGPLVLAFYKAECPTCQFTLPYLQKIYSETGSGGWELWGISQDDPEETRKFAERYGIGFDLLVDPYPFEVSSRYGLQFVPGIFVVQSDAKITLSDFGFSKDALNAIAALAAHQTGRPRVQLFHAGDGIPARRPG